MGGKLGRRRGQLNALGGLIFLQDLVSKQQFLVDTGAAVSVFPHRSSAATSGPLLAGADGKPISAWGKVTKKLNFGLHTFIVSFILAAVSKPILGYRLPLRSPPVGRSILQSCFVCLIPGAGGPHNRRRSFKVRCVDLPHRSSGPHPPGIISQHCRQWQGYAAATLWRLPFC